MAKNKSKNKGKGKNKLVEKGKSSSLTSKLTVTRKIKTQALESLNLINTKEESITSVAEISTITSNYNLTYACESNGSLPLSLNKYYSKRYKLFSKYDEEGWYSITPEKVAKHIASRIKVPVVVDGFCGVGGNAIQLALTCDLAIDIDPNRLALAQHNARVYKVDHKIQFLLGDFFDLIKNLKCDAIFLSPPWGGPNYSKRKVFDLKWIQPKDGKYLFNCAKQVTSNIAYYLPRNSNYKALSGLDKENKVEIEQQFSGHSFVAITAYYGNLVTSS